MNLLRRNKANLTPEYLVRRSVTDMIQKLSYEELLSFVEVEYIQPGTYEFKELYKTALEKRNDLLLQKLDQAVYEDVAFLEVSMKV